MQTLSLRIEYDRLAEHELPAGEAALCAAAKAATALAYAPYSAFRVGAAARLATGELVRAANLENAAYPQCLCAEATLLGAVHTQYPGAAIEQIAIAVDAAAERTEVAAPCGSCRQQLLEARARQGRALGVLLVLPEGGALRFADAADLLPLGFAL